MSAQEESAIGKFSGTGYLSNEHSGLSELEVRILDFEGNFNHAIMIRSFLSKNHTLHFQAGAGIVESSSEENEMQEVYNKLGALQKALDLAENI